MDRADRERTVQAVRHFAEHTTNCVGKKLFKLLYLADVTHFQITGRDITGLEYIARSSLPLPHELKFELEAPKADLLHLVHIDAYKEDDALRHNFQPSNNPGDITVFTPRQINILISWSVTFKTESHDAIDINCYDNGAWKKALQRRRGSLINMLDALDASSPNYADLVDIATEYREHRAARALFA